MRKIFTWKKTATSTPDTERYSRSKNEVQKRPELEKYGEKKTMPRETSDEQRADLGHFRFQDSSAEFFPKLRNYIRLFVLSLPSGKCERGITLCAVGKFKTIRAKSRSSSVP